MRQKGFALLCAGAVAVVAAMMVLPGAVARAGSAYNQVEELSLQELFGTRGDWRAVVFEGIFSECKCGGTYPCSTVMIDTLI